MKQILTITGAKRISEGWIAFCPAHDDSSRSLSLKQTQTGKVLWKCHAGCSQLAVFNALVLLGAFPKISKASVR
jgi:hypothetical protein